MFNNKSQSELEVENNHTQDSVKYYKLSDNFSYKLSKYLLKGDLIRKNTIWGLRLLKRSALTENNPESLYHLGVINFQGHKVKQDKATAFSLFKKATKNFKPFPDNHEKHKEILGYLTRIALFFIEELKGDNVRIADFYCKFKNAVDSGFHSAINMTIQYINQDYNNPTLSITINNNTIYTRSITAIEQNQIAEIIKNSATETIENDEL